MRLVTKYDGEACWAWKPKSVNTNKSRTKRERKRGGGCDYDEGERIETVWTTLVETYRLLDKLRGVDEVVIREKRYRVVATPPLWYENK